MAFTFLFVDPITVFGPTTASLNDSVNYCRTQGLVTWLFLQLSVTSVRWEFSNGIPHHILTNLLTQDNVVLSDCFRYVSFSSNVRILTDKKSFLAVCNIIICWEKSLNIFLPILLFLCLTNCIWQWLCRQQNVVWDSKNIRSALQITLHRAWRFCEPWHVFL